MNMAAPGMCRGVWAAQPPKGGPPLSLSVPSCSVLLAVWEGVLEMQSEMAAGLLTASVGPGWRESPAEELGRAGPWGTPRRVSSAWLPGSALCRDGAGLAAGSDQGLATFRWSWLSPCVSFGNGVSGLSAGNSRAASAQSKQLTHLLLLPLSQEM